MPISASISCRRGWAGPAASLLAVVIELLWIGLALAILVGTLQLMHFLQFQHSPGLGLRMDWVYGGILGGSVYTVIVAIRRLVEHARGNLAG